MKTAIICLSGGIGSGKTEVATALAARLGLPCVGFGNYVRTVALARRIPVDREQLQALGESLAAEGWLRFCTAVLTQANWHPGESIIVEGVRHAEALAGLATVTAPSRVALVYLCASEEARRVRLAAARPSEADILGRVEQHSTEIQVKSTLQGRANLVVDGEREVPTIVGEIASWFARELV